MVRAFADASAAPAEIVLDRLAWQVPPQPRGADADLADTLEFVLGQMPPDSSLG